MVTPLSTFIVAGISLSPLISLIAGILILVVTCINKRYYRAEAVV
jgi:hypothetical protein